MSQKADLCEQMADKVPEEDEVWFLERREARGRAYARKVRALHKDCSRDRDAKMRAHRKRCLIRHLQETEMEARASAWDRDRQEV